MCRPIFLLLPLWIVATFANQTPPGTPTRPILTVAEATLYTKSNYLQGWEPDQIQTSQADYTVGGNGPFTYIQEAVNAAIKAGGTKRKYIRIQKGIYKQVVFIPKTTVPITIYGTPGVPEDVIITMTQSAKTKGSEWANQVNPDGKVFKNGDPAWSLYNSCAQRATIDAFCSQVVWGKADNLEIAFLTIDNPSKNGPAVAVKFDGDKQNVDQLHLYGFQDTLYLNGRRIYLSNSTIKGDVDFIFGGSKAVFEGAQITSRSDRPRTYGVIFAPNTDSGQKYGFLVINSKITAENNTAILKGLSLARSGDTSPTCNGQLVIRETVIDNVINVYAPYATGSEGRPYSGNIAPNRNLDDALYSRFWEYANTGTGA